MTGHVSAEIYCILTAYSEGLELQEEEEIGGAGGVVGSAQCDVDFDNQLREKKSR